MEEPTIANTIDNTLLARELLEITENIKDGETKYLYLGNKQATITKEHDTVRITLKKTGN